MGRQFQGRGAGQHAHAALGQAVGRVARHGPILVHRRDIDNAASAPLGDHLLGRILGREEHPAQVDIQHLVVLLGSGVQHGGASFYPSIVNHHINAAVSGYGCID